MAESSFRRIRPFKVLAVFMTLVATILTLASLAGPDWVSVTLYSGEKQSWGLWWDCFKVLQERELCVKREWLFACAILVLFALIANIVSMVCGVVGLCIRNRLAYIISGCWCLFSLLCLIICLIVYPVMFSDEVKNEDDYVAETSKFSFDWTYGLAWSSVCFLIGAAVFFFIRVKEEHEAQPRKSAFGHETPPSFYNNKI